MNNKLYSLVVGFLIIVIALGYWYKSQPIEAQRLAVDNCQIANETCHITLDQQRSISIDVLPKGMPLTQALWIDVKTKNWQADAVRVVFEGIEIDHHLPAYHLVRQNDHQFSGKGFLSLCSLSKMHWNAHFILDAGSEKYEVVLPFVTQR